MVFVVDDYIAPNLEKVNKAINRKSLGKVGKSNHKQQKKDPKNKVVIAKRK